MFRFHATAKKTHDGFVPMITLRDRKGHMIGSRTPQGDQKEFGTFVSDTLAKSAAYTIALKAAARARAHGLQVVVA